MANQTLTRPLVWGHRGAMDFAPQNTLPSFLLAQEQGADGVELDVQLTKDGVVVVFHDARVEALTDGKGPLSQLPWAVVKTLDAGRHFGRSWAATRIPTLEEVLAKLGPHMTINVELKTSLSEDNWWTRTQTWMRGPKTLSEQEKLRARQEAQPLAEAVARLLLVLPPSRFVVSSFDPLAMEALSQCLPRTPGVSIPFGFLHHSDMPWDTPTLMRGIAYQAWHPHHSQVTEQSVAREKAAGRRIHVWTVNDPRHATGLAQLGVDALITNRPGEILDAL